MRQVRGEVLSFKTVQEMRYNKNVVCTKFDPIPLSNIYEMLYVKVQVWCVLIDYRNLNTRSMSQSHDGIILCSTPNFNPCKLLGTYTLELLSSAIVPVGIYVHVYTTYLTPVCSTVWEEH